MIVWATLVTVGRGVILLPVLLLLLPWKSCFVEIDAVNFLFIFLSTVILASISLWNKSFLFLFVVLFSRLCFIVREVLVFFIVFETIVFPIALYISTGKTSERTSAVLFFILYTLCSSIPFFGGLVWVFSLGGVTSFSLWRRESLTWLWVVIVVIFIIKFPVFLVHGWLPRAHVEAPTLGSVLLARILLKLGSYGLLRLLSICLRSFSQLTLPLRLIGAVLAGLGCFVSTDCKAFIAISRVSHIRALWACIISMRQLTTDPAILVSVSHGFVAGGLFLFIGFIYERRGSRSILVLRHGWRLSTLLILVWVLICFINAGLPPTASLFGELTVFQRIGAEFSSGILVLVVSGIIGGLFSFSLFDWSSFQKNSKQGNKTEEILLIISLICLAGWNFFIIGWL